MLLRPLENRNPSSPFLLTLNPVHFPPSPLYCRCRVLRTVFICSRPPSPLLTLQSSGFMIVVCCYLMVFFVLDFWDIGHVQGVVTR
jgi:hypothetical protein